MKFDSSKIRDSAKSLKESIGRNYDRLTKRGQEVWDERSPAMKQTYRDWKDASEEFAKSTGRRTKEQAKGMWDRASYTSDRMKKLERLIRHQGAHYRELCRERKNQDMFFLGGESLVTLLSASTIPDSIQKAYEAAYPEKAGADDLADQLSTLSGDELTGLLAGIKGKLFEQQYVDYLNDGNLPSGFTASIAEQANQPGWDIMISGPNDQLVEVIQAKATDSVGYVVDAINRNPQIDVVTTEEVYSHLVMSGVSESIVSNSGITNSSLEDALSEAVEQADLSLNFMPPWFTLGLIAFTTYKAEDLTLFEKARSAGDRTGKSYLSFLVGGALAAVTNTWWLGVVGTVASRHLADQGQLRRDLYENMSRVADKNDEIIDVMVIPQS